MFRFFSLVMFLCLGLGVDAKDCQHSESSFRCVEFVENYDGDTITVNIPNVHPIIGKQIGIRVKGVDTAEIRGSCGCEREMAYLAKEFVKNILENAESIELLNVDKGKYFRIVSDVRVDGIILSELLLENSLGYTYQGDTKPEVDWCRMKELFEDHSQGFTR